MALPKLLIPAVAFLGLSGAALYYIPCAMGPCDGAPALAEHEDATPCDQPCDGQAALAAVDGDAPCEEPCDPPCDDEKALAAAPGVDEEPCPMAAKRQAEALAALNAEQAEQAEAPAVEPSELAAAAEPKS